MMNKSDSTEQQMMERIIFNEIEKKLSLKLEANPKISIGSSHLSYIQPDFYSEESKIVGEIFVHIGKTKKAQDNKISNDIMKMLLLEKKHNCNYRKILVFCDEAVIKKVTGFSWLSECIKEFNIEIMQIELSEEQKQLIEETQKRQRMS